MRTQLAVIVGALGLVLAAAAAPLSAHHAFAAEFDANKPVNFKGTLTRVEWVNPHVWIHVDVKKPDGTVEKWAIEMNSPNNLALAGWRRTTLKPGDRVRIWVHPLRNGARGGNYAGVRLANGSTLGQTS